MNMHIENEMDHILHTYKQQGYSEIARENAISTIQYFYSVSYDIASWMFDAQLCKNELLALKEEIAMKG